MMRKWLAFFAAVLANGCGDPARAAWAPEAPSAQVTSTATVAENAMELTVILTNKELMLEQAKRMTLTTVPDAFRSDPNIGAMEKSSPGVIEAIVQAMLPILLKQTENGIPILRQRYSDHLAKTMTVDELGKAIEFYGSPIGRKLIAGVSSQMSGETMMKEAMTSQSHDISREALLKDVRDAAESAVSKLTPDELKKVAAFGLSPAGQKFTSSQKVLSEIVAAWTNESSSEEDAEIEEAVTKAIADHLENSAKQNPSKTTS